MLFKCDPPTHTVFYILILYFWFDKHRHHSLNIRVVYDTQTVNLNLPFQDIVCTAKSVSIYIRGYVHLTLINRTIYLLP